MPSIAGRDMGQLLSALAAELQDADAPPIELCVVGGAALGMLGLVERPTKDIDVVAVAGTQEGGIRVYPAHSLPTSLLNAVAAVAHEFEIEPSWINNGPASLIDNGLPSGLESRLTSVRYGPALTVHFAGRVDQICFKTYAAADVAGRHLTD